MHIALDCITAISTLATAVVAILVYLGTIRQLAISLPVIQFSTGGDSNNDYRSISVEIAEPDNKKFKLEKLVILSPESARLAKKVSSAENKAVPGDWQRELVIDYLTSSTSVYFRGPRGSKIDISVHVCLRSDVKVKSRLTISSSMHD